eukprot:1565456-Karenia_brevis.AAC.1
MVKSAGLQLSIPCTECEASVHALLRAAPVSGSTSTSDLLNSCSPYLAKKLDSIGSRPCTLPS